MLKMILKDLRLSPLRSILTSVSMLVGIIAMIGSVLVGTLGREYLISVNAQVYGWSPTYSFVITESDFHDRNKMEQLFQRFEAIDDVAAVVALVLGSQLILSIFVCFAAILISLILVHCIGALLPVDSPVGTQSYPISVAVVAVAVSVLTALLGGLLPALKAAKLEPALALR